MCDTELSSNAFDFKSSSRTSGLKVRRPGDRQAIRWSTSRVETEDPA